jgi:hypothetical protein
MSTVDLGTVKGSPTPKLPDPKIEKNTYGDVAVYAREVETEEGGPPLPPILYAASGRFSPASTSDGARSAVKTRLQEAMTKETARAVQSSAGEERLRQELRRLAKRQYTAPSEVVTTMPISDPTGPWDPTDPLEWMQTHGGTRGMGKDGGRPTDEENADTWASFAMPIYQEVSAEKVGAVESTLAGLPGSPWMWGAGAAFGAGTLLVQGMSSGEREG